VLRPGGRLAAFWHVFQLPPDLAEAFAEVYERLVPEAPVDVRWLTGPPEAACAPMLTKAATGSVRPAGSVPRRSGASTGSGPTPANTWLDQLPTIGLLTRLPQDRLAEILEGVGAAVDKMGGTFTMRYSTVAVHGDADGARCLVTADRWRGDEFPQSARRGRVETVSAAPLAYRELVAS